jgi:hypothetical protein
MCGYDNKLEINWKAGGTEKIKYNNHKIKELENFKWLGNKIVTNGSVKKKLQKE